MVIQRRTYKISQLAFCVLCAAQAHAGEPIKPLTLNAKYIVAWSGVPLGRVILTSAEDDKTYRMTVDAKTKGLGALINDEKRIIEVQGTRTASGEYLPTRYQSRPQKDPTEDTITLTYDAHGALSTRERTHDDDPAWRPPVPATEVGTARDPITASFILRRKLYDAVAANQPSVGVRTYDGERLALMKMTRAANAKVAMMDSYRDAVNVTITREPINGYTPKELKKFKKGDPEIHLYFTNDAAFLPIRASAKSAIGELSLTFDSYEK